ncbi:MULTISPECIES: amidase family protein [Microbacterium]|uniref:amidase family protein n=1 Tax=Microbacterium TaxID=33882 RepID=UPI00277DDF0A|nr:MULTISPECIES: amidase family protein [Microbacterium]MDQ1082603.1 Asp-tRNA(Asn)/Glu-tRNA(Gln) amidotransferase A subunit family amidase [Microbacterium sp. SORGH_AS_0344]MDQ1168625.1 Asp-tRNA(Asn)/Glu-tRNA(Gln) amidotransferase A subunit family amidase [Microbacterium proteolyticum]
MTSTRTAMSDDHGIWTQRADEASLASLESSDAFPLAVKANIAVRGLRRSAGCRVLDVAAEDADAPVVAALRHHGAVVMGMANMHELALGVTSDNAAYGPARVPSAPHLSAGGSSGGSAAAVAAGLVPLALGTDTGGSVSIPASNCGVVGFRPSTGRWPTAGIVGLSWTRDTPGVFAATVVEAARVDSWVTSSTAAPPVERPRLGIPTAFLHDLDARTEQAFHRTLDAWRPGVDVVEVDLSDVLVRTRPAEPLVVGWEAPRELASAAARALHLAPDEAFAALRSGVETADVAAFLDAIAERPVTADEYARALSLVLDARRLAADAMDRDGVDALVFPTTPAPAPPSGGGASTRHRDRDISVFELYTRHTGPGTILGAPMVTIPALAEDVPVGVTVQGRRFDDARILTLCAQLQSVLLEAASSRSTVGAGR